LYVLEIARSGLPSWLKSPTATRAVCRIPLEVVFAAAKRAVRASAFDAVKKEKIKIDTAV
jgi:hypothetical protein